MPARAAVARCRYFAGAGPGLAYSVVMGAGAADLRLFCYLAAQMIKIGDLFLKGTSIHPELPLDK